MELFSTPLKTFLLSSSEPEVNRDYPANNDWKFHHVHNEFHTIRAAHVIDSNKDNCELL